MCGIFGFIGSPKSKFDLNKFNILGIYNDSRGGDSCGIFVDGLLEKGADKQKLFSTFILSNENYNSLKNNPNIKVALGHCRKASVGHVTIEQAHPIIVKDEEDNIELVMIHNGTLLNHKELAKKYDIKTTFGESDSMIFARIVNKVGFDVLSEYNGAGAFVFHKPKTGDVYFYQGASKNTEYSKELTEERPFFLISQSGGYYFSSIGEILNLINSEKEKKVLSLEPNHLYHLVNGRIKELTHYDRKDRYQTETKYYGGANIINNQTTFGSKNNNVNNNNDCVIPYYPIEDLNDYYPIYGHIKLYKGTYSNIEGIPANGILDLNVNGGTKSYNSLKDASYKKFFIHDGVIVKNYMFYKAIKFYQEIKNNLNGEELTTLEKAIFSIHPVWDKDYKVFLYQDVRNRVEYFTGIYKILFSHEKEYRVKDGMINAYSYVHINNDTNSTYKSAFDEYKEDTRNAYFIRLEENKPEKFKRHIKDFLNKNIEGFSKIDKKIVDKILIK